MVRISQKWFRIAALRRITRQDAYTNSVNSGKKLAENRPTGAQAGFIWAEKFSLWLKAI